MKVELLRLLEKETTNKQRMRAIYRRLQDIRRLIVNY